jgi:hypothetical protein
MRKPRHQVTLILLPGSEPWIAYREGGGKWRRLPAMCSLLELWEELEAGSPAARRVEGELYMRVPLGDALTIGEVRRRRQTGTDTGK